VSNSPSPGPTLLVHHPPPLPPLRYTGYFSEGQLRGIMRQLFAGLGYLHMCHVMHRDIKPDNILVQHQEMVVLAYTSRGFVPAGNVTIPFNSNVVWKRSCPAGFSLLSEYVLLPSDDGHVLLALAADPAGVPVQPPLPLSASFTLISVDLHVRIADFGLARECVPPRTQPASASDADAGAAGAIKSTWTRLKVSSLPLYSKFSVHRLSLLGPNAAPQRLQFSGWTAAWRKPANSTQSTSLF
jgi:serine/threonine protein kinase